MSDNTIKYYDDNAESFIQTTVDADMSDTRKLFLSFIPAGGKILDAGCGSGRDSLFFIEAGYQVIPMDASEQMCIAASRLTGIPALNQSFDDLCADNEYDGIWACASLLHINGEHQPIVWQKLLSALKSGGIMYASYKEGTFSGFRNGRYFYDMTLEAVTVLVERFSNIEIMKLWKTKDVRPGVDTEWVNILAKKSFH